MLKNAEISNPTSCFNRARDNEMLFVLLGRDPAAADTIRFWIKRRIELGKNKPGDPQLVTAETTALYIELKLSEQQLSDPDRDFGVCPDGIL